MKRLLPLIVVMVAAGCGDGPKTADPKPADNKPDPRIQRAGGTTETPPTTNTAKRMTDLKEK